MDTKQTAPETPTTVPEIGDCVAGDDGEVYEVLHVYGPIQTGEYHLGLMARHSGDLIWKWTG